MKYEEQKACIVVASDRSCQQHCGCTVIVLLERSKNFSRTPVYDSLGADFFHHREKILPYCPSCAVSFFAMSNTNSVQEFVDNGE